MRMSFDDTEIVSMLIKAGADVNEKTAKGRTALMWASDRGFIVTVSALIEAGADVNAKDRYGRTALMMAAEKGHTEIVKLLKEHGATE